MDELVLQLRGACGRVARRPTAAYPIARQAAAEQISRTHVRLVEQAGSARCS